MSLLTVGTDCSIGKMYTALALERSMRKRGLAADFRATGQTGILIANGGIPVDAVIADFISGAAELISPARNDGGWDLIEGQGSLFHASYAGVSLGLLHGSQPDALVMCHEPTRTHMRGLPDAPLPDIKTCRTCHLGEDARKPKVASSCAMCHSYHPRGSLPPVEIGNTQRKVAMSRPPDRPQGP